MNITQFPLIRITFWFIIGILIAFFTKISLPTAFIVLAISCIGFGFVYYKSNKVFTPKIHFGIMVYCVFFALGLTTTAVNNPSSKKNHYTQNESNFDGDKKFHIVLIEKLKNSAKYSRYYAKVISIDNKTSFGKILVNIKTDSVTKSLKIGNQLLVDGQLLHHFKPNNPNQFDYGKYIETKGIYGQIYTTISAIKINSTTEKNLLYYTATFRNTIIENLQKSGFKKEELAVIIALILGQQQDISPEVLRDYQYAGAIHILSVSGLHVGFILLFITFLLRPIPNTTLGNSTKLFITLVSLWLFAFVAGLAPSVLRSTVMFSFLAIGLYLKRGTNSFHTTIVSMLIILLFEPLFIFDIGFQLSYLAVIFIIWLQPLFNTLWEPKNKFAKYFWDIVTVSFAAQIGTLPLSIYYFHQFPGLFFVTNVVLIPFLSIIMALGTLLMILAFFNFIPVLLSKSVAFLITIINLIISKIASFESFIFTGIPLSFTLMIISYLIIVSFTLWYKKPKFNLLVIGLTSIILFQSVMLFTKWNSEKNTEFIVFNVRKKSIIGLREGSALSLLASEEIEKNSFEDRMIQTYITSNYYSINNIVPMKNIVTHLDKKIQIIDSSATYKTSLSSDIIVLRQSPKVNLDRVIDLQKPKAIIADASNYKNYIESWKKTCDKRKIPFHNTYEKGFYCLKN